MKTGHVTGVNGNLVSVEFDTSVIQNEVAFVKVSDGARLKSEVIRVRGRQADLQVFEATNGIKVGDPVEFTNELLSVELGPGLLTQVLDGLQNPLPRLADESLFLKRGTYIYPLDDKREWEYTPTAKVGDELFAGDEVGWVPEGIFRHKIMLPFAWSGSWRITWTASAGKYTIRTVVAKAVNDAGEEREMTMVQSWPIRLPISAYKEKLLPVEPMITQVRSIDTFFPVAKGGTFCTPGPFGAGKTVLQHALSQRSEADVVIVAAVGERAGEVVEILQEFPVLEDPRTGRKLIDRTIIICNTSSMPVASRESSIYTSVTLAEYYRQM
ncbi:MAG: V-type ATP synthase subunit A, partial [Lentisphaeria bacterium]|nr:V-type ATP synthase subunit A [Lentisphaeria bacterium]